MPYRIHVNAGTWKGPVTLLEAAARAALDEADDPDAEVSVTLVADEEMVALNRRYLQRDGTTDVIAFSLGEDDRVLGDVYVCLPQAVRQAEEAGVPIEEELVRLGAHGTLHVLGHDHPEGPDRWTSPMFALQEEIVRTVLEGRQEA